MLYRIEYFVHGKFRGALLAEGRTEMDARENASRSMLYQRLRLIGMVKCNIEPVEDPILPAHRALR